MRRVIRVLSEGRIDRGGFVMLLLVSMIAVLIVARYLAGLPDFTTSGALLDDVWNGRWTAYGAAVSGLAPLTQSMLVGLHVAFGVFLIGLGALRLRDIGWPPLLSAPFLILAPPFFIVVLAVTPGGFGRSRRAVAPSVA